jgi:hypothetical protein
VLEEDFARIPALLERTVDAPASPELAEPDPEPDPESVQLGLF